MNILLVDDEKDIAEMLAHQIRRSNYSVAVATSVPKAIEIIDSEAQIDLLVTDAHLPDGNVRNILSHFKSRFPTSKMMVISGRLEAKENIERDLPGINLDFLEKPFEIKTLVSWIAATLNAMQQKTGS